MFWSHFMSFQSKSALLSFFKNQNIKTSTSRLYFQLQKQYLRPSLELFFGFFNTGPTDLIWTIKNDGKRKEVGVA